MFIVLFKTGFSILLFFKNKHFQSFVQCGSHLNSMQYIESNIRIKSKINKK